MKFKVAGATVGDGTVEQGRVDAGNTLESWKDLESHHLDLYHPRDTVVICIKGSYRQGKRCLKSDFWGSIPVPDALFPGVDRYPMNGPLGAQDSSIAW